jgi:hypothetical protein
VNTQLEAQINSGLLSAEQKKKKREKTGDICLAWRMQRLQNFDPHLWRIYCVDTRYIHLSEESDVKTTYGIAYSGKDYSM